jgi:hypothetical protein
MEQASPWPTLKIDFDGFGTSNGSRNVDVQQLLL